MFKITEMFETALKSFADFILVEQIQTIKYYIGDDVTRMDIASEIIYDSLSGRSGKELSDRDKNILMKIYQNIDMRKFYTRICTSGDKSQKAFALRKLCKFEAFEHNRLFELVDMDSVDLKYNAAMTLSLIGDHAAIVSFFTGVLPENYSYRIMIEIIDTYRGDRLKLAQDILADCDDYVKGIVIKAVAKYKFEGLNGFYLDNLNNKNLNIRIACIRALGMLMDPRSERELIMMMNDKEWTVRSATAQSLGGFKGESSLEALSRATSDENWWVRHNAAKALVSKVGSESYIDKIINGFDRYASEAVQYAVYKK
jgi:hypothetical protein